MMTARGKGARAVVAGVFCGSQLLLSACGLSELDGLSAGGDTASAGSAQAGGRAGGPDALFADGEPVGGAGGGSMGGSGGEAIGGAGGGTGGQVEGGGTGGEDDGGGTGGGASDAETEDGQADVSLSTDGSCSMSCDSCSVGGTCNCSLVWTGPNCDTTGLVLYWKLDETSGVVTNDSSGNGLTGAYTAVSGLPTQGPGNVLSSMTSWDQGSLSFQGTTLRQVVFLAGTTPNFE